MTYRVYIKKDYKLEIVSKQRRAKQLYISAIFSLTLVTGISLYFISTKQIDDEIIVDQHVGVAGLEPSQPAETLHAEVVREPLDQTYIELITVPILEDIGNNSDSVALKIDETSSIETITENYEWQSVTVKQGDSLALIFSRLGLHANELYRIMTIGKDVSRLKRIQPGQILHFQIEDNQIKALEYEYSLTSSLSITRNNNNFVVTQIEHALDTVIKHAKATITDSLFLSGKRAGLSDNLIMQLVGIYGWDIDFALDIRQGDSYTVIYEEKYKNGKKVSDGPILAAEFNNKGDSIRAIRYSHQDGSIDYYEDNGNAMRKAFLRTPVNFTRISSHFNLKRKHPILNKFRAHKGVDYAAPTGTPIKATGDGTIVHAGNKGGYGKTVILKHGGKYSTVYAHLHKYAKGVSSGKRVKQGQTIGYVGMSGLATGPHLHYEFRLNGVHRNPLTVELPHVESISNKDMPLFVKNISPMLAELDRITGRSSIAAQPELISENNLAARDKKGS